MEEKIKNEIFYDLAKMVYVLEKDTGEVFMVVNVQDFKAYALEKINECNTLMTNEPMTSDLAFDIYEIALNLNDIRHSYFENEEELEFIGNFYNCAVALESAVKDMENFFNVED